MFIPQGFHKLTSPTELHPQLAAVVQAILAAVPEVEAHFAVKDHMSGRLAAEFYLAVQGDGEPRFELLLRGTSGLGARFTLKLAEGFEAVLSSAQASELTVGLLQETLVAVAERLNLQTVKSWIAHADDPTLSPYGEFVWINKTLVRQTRIAQSPNNIEVRSYHGTYAKQAKSELESLANWKTNQTQGWEEDYAHAPWFEGGIPLALGKELLGRAVRASDLDPKPDFGDCWMWGSEDAMLVLDKIDELNSTVTPDRQISVIHGFGYDKTDLGLKDLLGFWDTAPGYGTDNERKILLEAKEEGAANAYFHFRFFIGKSEEMDRGLGLAPSRRRVPTCSILIALMVIVWLIYRCAR
ncbi:hypothetical protein IT575_12535 [bacterium]|nr:hypothetical protein [bacterium]